MCDGGGDGGGYDGGYDCGYDCGYDDGSNDYSCYNGDPAHDMEVDYLYQLGTGENVTGSDDIIYQQQYYASRQQYQPQLTTEQRIKNIKTEISICEENIHFSQIEAQDIAKKLKNPRLRADRAKKLAKRQLEVEEELAAYQQELKNYQEIYEKLKDDQKIEFVMAMISLLFIFLCLVLLIKCSGQ